MVEQDLNKFIIFANIIKVTYIKGNQFSVFMILSLLLVQTPGTIEICSPYNLNFVLTVLVLQEYTVCSLYH